MKNKRTIGYVMMIVAVIIPLYILGSMSIDILSQEKKYREFLEAFSMDNASETNRIDKALAYNKNLNSSNMPVDPFDSEGYKVNYKISDDPDAVFAYMTIPSIDVSQPVYLGASFDHLLTGFAHVDGTALPIGEKNTRSVIAAHRGGYYGRLDLLYAHKIKKGDILKLDLGTDVLEYKMISSEIISPDQWEKMKPIPGKELLTLITCDPFPTYENRMLIDFERVVKKTGPKEEVANAKVNDESLSEKRNSFIVTNADSSIKSTKYLLFAICIGLLILLVFLIVKLFRIY